MKVMISRSERGRALIKTMDGVNLQDLSRASDAQIKAVAELAWEIKRLFHALIWGKASDVLGDLNIAPGATLNPGLVADLTASIPRDVVVGAHLQWLPNLASEMANRQAPGSAATQVQPGADARQVEHQSAGSQDQHQQEGHCQKHRTTSGVPGGESGHLPFHRQKGSGATRGNTLRLCPKAPKLVGQDRSTQSGLW